VCSQQVLECKKGALKAHQQLHATLGEKASCEAQFQHSKQELKTEEDRLAGKFNYLNLTFVQTAILYYNLTLSSSSSSNSSSSALLESCINSNLHVGYRCVFGISFNDVVHARSYEVYYTASTAVCHRAHVECMLTAVYSRSLAPFVYLIKAQ
jgi:hypothetical protein